MEDYSMGYAQLCVQRALLGVVSAKLRAVIIDLYRNEQKLYIRFYYDQKASEELVDLWECAITEASAGMGGNCSVDDGVERLDFPQKIPFRGQYAFLRKEEDQRDCNPYIYRNLLEYSNPQQLLEDYHGTGKAITTIPPGKTGYAEMVNFDRFIGYVIHRETTKKIKTHYGIIHYSKTGSEIIPAYSGTIKKLKILPIGYALLSIQVALLQKVTSELRAVIVDFIDDTTTFYIRFYYDGAPDEELLDILYKALFEVCADLGSSCLFDAKIERLDYPEKIPYIGRVAYERKE